MHSDNSGGFIFHRYFLTLPKSTANSKTHIMQYIEFINRYPVLNAHLVNLAANRIAQTPAYLESSTRSRISEVNHQLDRMLFDFVPKHEGLSYKRDDLVRLCRHYSPEFRTLEEDREQLLSLLVSAKKAPNIPVTTANIIAATTQVKDYISQLLLQGSTAALFRWHGVLSGEEKYLLADCHRFEFFHSKAHGIDNWWYASNHGYIPLWEPVLETITHKDMPIGYITENSYGVRCLNSPFTMFVDIDTDSDADDISLACLPFGKYKWNVQMSLDVIREFCDRNPGVAFAVYRTRNGLRLLELANDWDARSEDAVSVLEALGSDVLFTSLCQRQGTFRARLEVKPWREELGVQQSVCLPLDIIGHAAKATSNALKIKAVHDRWCVRPGNLA